MVPVTGFVPLRHGETVPGPGVQTDDEFLKASGSSDKLYGVIQERFGDTKEAIKAKLDKLNLP